ncbi:hypothetical protein EV426DRAFT_701828 [Tirmania nivea]|nr:hypothetical protein EV426DRAFT_701828 [Tirmania nivea]
MQSYSFRPTTGACPFCHKRFKSAGALTNHLENEHPNCQYRPPKRKYGKVDGGDDGEDDAKNTMDATLSTREKHSEEELWRLFSEFVDFTLHENDNNQRQLQQREEITYHQDNEIDNSDIRDTDSDGSKPIENGIRFSADREAGKVIVLYPFTKERHSMYNFFRPFQHALDFKLARFFYSSQVLKTRINEFFKDDFFGQKTDAGRTLRFSFHSAYTLFQKIDEMIIDPP